MSKKMQWPVKIEEVDNGYQVQVGCMKLVFESQEKLLAELMAYMNGNKTLMSEELKILRSMTEPMGRRAQTLQGPPPEQCEPSREYRENSQS